MLIKTEKMRKKKETICSWKIQLVVLDKVGI
jgi:hypothetical protein